MKKTKASLIALVLSFLLAMPVVALASPFDEIEERIENGVVFVPLRQIAYAFGSEIQWDHEARLIHIILPGGFPQSIHINEITMLGGFVENGVSWIPLDIAEILFAPIPIRLIELTSEAQEYVIEDFEYLMDLILTNSPWANVIYRRLGVDLDEIIDFNRYVIYNMYPLAIPLDLPEDLDWQRDHDTARDLAADYLFALLVYEFSLPVDVIGHMSPVPPFLYRDMLAANLRLYLELGGSPDSNFENWLILQTLSHPMALWFYGDDEIDFETEGLGYYNPYNIRTDIIVPGEIAMISIDSFINNAELDDSVIYPFLNKIQDFDHLIIDIRGNSGGYESNFNNPILRRLISEPIEVSGHEFFGSGDLVTEWVDYFLTWGILGTGTITDIYVMPAIEFVEYHDMAYINEHDLEMLEYVVIWFSMFEPADDQIDFDGKIWLLVDDGSASVSAAITLIALETGFATVVGENTSGIMGALTSFVVLPNTGIIFRIDVGYITDMYGRSFEEYGIAPNVRNLPGMDALQTVLTLIELGEY
ncbi:MAG: S41 family peptidase [Defluviitaleaceae bacterium]|nr:S41 family peptidase [Defluviitaleaceae bacterium]